MGNWVDKSRNLVYRYLHKKGRPHRAAPIPTNLCEECRNPFLIVSDMFVSTKNTFLPREEIKKETPCQSLKVRGL